MTFCHAYFFAYGNFFFGTTWSAGPYRKQACKFSPFDDKSENAYTLSVNIVSTLQTHG